ncbi:MAG TPA: TIGR04283 family arsenosugar biosynthesis glycosyltransferase [Novimethylophilus sp.]|jgi:rSAM/selenodomain-associated transferase 2|uniref:TIGR04283 family arsenosugar biosynthesis glycosyltransferase n=1 Tax=Novimethylophilus sp. TaxID=2137426 RepID=UPI002F3F11D0
MESLAEDILIPFMLYGYLAVFLGVMLDNAGFPVPGELVLLLTGSLVASGHFDFAPVVAVAAAGALLSDSAWYYAGRRGSRRIIQYYCKFSFGSAACMAKTERQLMRFGPKSLLYARFIPGFRTFAAPMSGMSGMAYRQFALYDGIGAGLWATLGVAVGALFAHRIGAIIGMLENSRVVLLYLVASLLLLFLLTKWLVRRRHGAAALADIVEIHEPFPAQVSVIMPALNEAEAIVNTLAALQPLRATGHAVIVVDGGSTDDTILRARPLADTIIASPRGRSRQMNAGAACATGDILLFLHADTCLPDDAVHAVLDGLASSGKAWGRFDVRLSGRHPLLRVVERMMNRRSRLTGIATGDQAIFVHREAFRAVGGFPEIPLMEDIALSRTLKKRFGTPLCLSTPVATSSRRWEEHGILRTILLMWKLRLAYFMGASPERLARQYTRREAVNERT